MSSLGRIARTLGLAAALLALGACGTVIRLNQAPSTGALTAGSVGFRQTGNAAASIASSSILYSLDDSGALVVHFNLTSQAGSDQTIEVRASLYDSGGDIIGDATGGAVMVAPGATVAFELNGPAPQGTIASATFEVTAEAS